MRELREAYLALSNEAKSEYVALSHTMDAQKLNSTRAARDKEKRGQKAHEEAPRCIQ